MDDSLKIISGNQNTYAGLLNNSNLSKTSETLVSYSENKDRHENNVDTKINKSYVEKITEQINKKNDLTNKGLKFFVHKATGEVGVKIINKETNEVIKEIPASELLDLEGRIQDMVGLIIDRKS